MNAIMPILDRITFDPNVMGRQACIRGMRVTVAAMLDLLAAGTSREQMLILYPYLEAADLDQALAYAAWRETEQEMPLSPA